ncbi:MAG: hypothetical protein E6H64_04600 [Betaproteobacteria bacterium]|nr:MAG: hypothetical protein E6H64_04600 [Betaproteobacteria bacterium]
MTLNVSWEQYNALVERLALQVYDSDWRFNQIICIALGGTAHAECSRNIIGVHRRAAVTQLFENLVAARNVDVVATAVRRAPHLSRRHVNIFLRLFL